MSTLIEATKKALEGVLKVGRGTSGRLILESKDEQNVRDAITALGVERIPYAWEVTQGGRKFLLSAQEFTGNSYDCATFKPLYEY